MADLIQVTEQNWAAEVLESDLPVMVDFSATYCPPCKALAPTVAEIAREQAGRLKVVVCNTDNAQSVAQRYGIMTVPQLLLFKGGKVVDQLLGNQPKPRIMQKLQPHL